MKKDFTKSRLIALLSVFIFVFSLVLSGCSVGKKVDESDKTTQADDIINIGQGGSDIPPDSQIIIGADGQSYLVDGEGNSIVYNPQSEYYNPITPNTPVTPITPNTPNTPETPNTPNTPNIPNTPNTPEQPEEPNTPETPNTPEQPVEPPTSVFDLLSQVRSVGPGNVNGTHLDTLKVYFTYNNKDWLISLWKGAYGDAHIGCEIGFYTAAPSASGSAPLDPSVGVTRDFKPVGNDDKLSCSMKLWQYAHLKDKDTGAVPALKINSPMKSCKRNYSFVEGNLENINNRNTLVMSGTIQFPTLDMMELFLNGLDEQGFSSDVSESYRVAKGYSVNDKNVTVIW